MMLPAFHGNIGFNAHHSPMGAYFSFTCGHAGTRGGMGLQMGRPAEQDIFVGYKEGGRYADVPLKVLPFFKGADGIDPAAAYLPEKKGEDRQRFAPFKVEEMRRQYGWGTDRWSVGGMEFSVYTAFGEIPEPGVGGEVELKKALCPAVVAEVRVDNRGGTGVKTGFFAINFHDGGVRLLELEGNRVGIGFRRELGFAGEVVEVGEDQRCMGKVEGAAFPFIKWWPHEGLEDRSNPVHLLGTCGGIGFEVPAGKHYALRVTLACHLDGVVTSRLEGRYFYNRYFSNVEAVLNYAGPLFSTFKKAASALDKQLLGSGLSADQQFLIAHATRSYYGNTQLLEVEGEPYWVVNEGEYQMMNTLDLAVDQVFWELERNPWVVRNLLDNFLKRYSYTDDVKVLTEGTENTERRRGGISFCHDQGTHNQFSPVGTSAYELKDLRGCFSFMTQEELYNWLLIAGTYVKSGGGVEWAKRNSKVLQACGESLLARDYLNSDSALTGKGAEITTYDSLDESLGQARDSLYMAMKRHSSCCALADIFGILGDDGAQTAWHEEAFRELRTALKLFAGENYLRALINSSGAIAEARVLPAIEALVYVIYVHVGNMPPIVGRGEEPFAVLKNHVRFLLSDNENKFADGGIRLTSTSDNTWLSKIAIVQFVARVLFNMDENGKERSPNSGASGWEKADAAHVKWLTTGAGAYWCACDQIVKGEAKGSKYYPRLVTCALWLKEVGL